jgi:uncharacterized lipoprotein
MKKILFASLLLIGLAACSKKDKKDYDQMAKDLCGCMRPLADMNQKIKSLVNEGKTQEVSDLFSEVERLSNEGESCAKNLEEKYGIIEGESEEKATVALKKHCPDIAAMLEQSESLEQ